MRSRYFEKIITDFGIENRLMKHECCFIRVIDKHGIVVQKVCRLP